MQNLIKGLVNIFQMANVLDVKKYLNGLLQIVESGEFADALVSAINTGNGLMQQRVFTHGQDVEGNSFGGYVGKKTTLGIESQRRLLSGARSTVQRNRIRRSNSPLTPYERKRVQAGRQIGYKDLEFNGELRRSIQVFIEDEKTVILAFNNSESALIARGQEQQIENIRQGRPGTTQGTGATLIFAFSDDEQREVVDQGVELIVNQVLK